MLAGLTEVCRHLRWPPEAQESHPRLCCVLPATGVWLSQSPEAQEKALAPSSKGAP